VSLQTLKPITPKKLLKLINQKTYFSEKLYISSSPGWKNAAVTGTTAG